MYPMNCAIFFVLDLCAQHVNITILVQLNYEVARNLGMPVSGTSQSTNLPPLVPLFYSTHSKSRNEDLYSLALYFTDL